MNIGSKEGKQHFLSYNEIADLIDVSPSTLRSYFCTGRMPQPDATIGNTPGWTIPTITEWMRLRPGPGARTDLLKEKK